MRRVGHPEWLYDGYKILKTADVVDEGGLMSGLARNYTKFKIERKWWKTSQWLLQPENQNFTEDNHMTFWSNYQ